MRQSPAIRQARRHRQFCTREYVFVRCACPSLALMVTKQASIDESPIMDIGDYASSYLALRFTPALQPPLTTDSSGAALQACSFRGSEVFMSGRSSMHRSQLFVLSLTLLTLTVLSACGGGFSSSTSSGTSNSGTGTSGISSTPGGPSSTGTATSAQSSTYIFVGNSQPVAS